MYRKTCYVMDVELFTDNHFQNYSFTKIVVLMMTVCAVFYSPKSGLNLIKFGM